MYIALLIEDDVNVAQTLKAGMSSLVTVEVAPTSEVGLMHLSLYPERYDAIVVDLNLPDSKGEATIIEIQKQVPNLPIIAITGEDGDCNFAKAIQVGAQDYLIKGSFTFQEFTRTIKYSIERHKVRQVFRPIEESIQAATEQLKNLEERVK